MITVHREMQLADLSPSLKTFEAEFIAGLRRCPKMISSKYFYDERGSSLFDQICELDEYYLTRTETAILRSNINEIAALCGPRCVLIELGSGSSRKTRLLLDQLETPVAYIPIDISRAHLLAATEALNGDYLSLEILPVCADYSAPLTLPAPKSAPQRRIIFFPGSTIGNLEPRQAARFLYHIANLCEPGDGLLIGVDLEKDHELLHRAYNDEKGVTAAFNLNLLQRANTEVDANFQLEQFRHEASYEAKNHRIEMRLVSCCEQHVRIGTDLVWFAEEERITTEYSYKYKPESFHTLAATAGWQNQRTWIDESLLFSVHYLKLAERSS